MRPALARAYGLGRLAFLAAEAPAPSIPITAIAADGWTATYPSPPTLDPVGDPETITVQSPGFDSSGSATTVSRTVTLMTRIREPYPDQASLTTSDVAVSEFVHAGDTISGVTNNSTRAHLAPQGMWMLHDLERATSTTFTVRLAVAHAYGRSGRPVAAVVFTASDESGNSVSVTVTSMSSVSYATGMTVPCFDAELDLSTLDQGEMITVDAEIRPWVGEAFTLSTDADTYPSPNLTVLKFLNDKTGGYGTAYAYVNPLTGDDGTGVVSENPALSAATPFATLAASATAVQSYNNANFSRNNASGGIIRLTDAAVHTFSSFSSVAVGEIPLLIEADPANSGAAILQDAGSSVSNGWPDKVKLSGLTIRRNASGNVIFFDCDASVDMEEALIFDGCTFDDNGHGVSWGAYIYRTGRTWFINCDGDDLGQGEAFSNESKAIIAIGSGAGSASETVYHMLGCKDLDVESFTVRAASSNRPASVGAFCGWCFLGSANASRRIVDFEADVGARGAAFVGSIFEQSNSNTPPAVFIGGDDDVFDYQNVNFHCNTVVGSRVNFLYNDVNGSPSTKSGSYVGNITRNYNTKSDVFALDTTSVGNWPIIHKLNYGHNTYIEGSNQNDVYGAGNWIGEVGALGDVLGTNASPVVVDFADDQSFGQGGGGDGDYTPGASYAGALIPAGAARYNVDQAGTAIPNDGTGVSGALQQ